MRSEIRSFGRALGPAVALVAACTLVACGKGPTEPSQVEGNVVSIAIQGTVTMERPGDAGQLTAVATLADGTTKDVTSVVSWRTGGKVVRVPAAGSLLAVEYGTDQLTVSYLALKDTMPLRVAPAGAFLFSGLVRTAAGLPLSNTRVESSSDCGTLETTTDAGGRYILPAMGGAALKVEVEGFEPAVQQFIAQSDGQMDFVLQHLNLPGDPSGVYRLTVTASASCTTLPSTLLQRTYDARVETVGNDVYVTLSGAEFDSWGTPGFTGTRAGPQVHFTLSGTWWADGFSFVEGLQGGYSLGFDGSAEGVVEADAIGATFNGVISYLDWLENGPSCRATDHQLAFTRAGGH